MIKKLDSTPTKVYIEKHYLKYLKQDFISTPITNIMKYNALFRLVILHLEKVNQFVALNYFVKGSNYPYSGKR